MKDIQKGKGDKKRVAYKGVKNRIISIYVLKFHTLANSENSTLAPL